MSTTDTSLTLDRRRLREATLGDEDLMREVLCVLLEDAPRQMGLLADAIESQDLELTRRLAHYSRGACANIGAAAAADALLRLESHAALGQPEACSATLRAFGQSIENLRREVAGYWDESSRSAGSPLKSPPY